MAREQFQERLDALRDDVLRMGDVVVTRLQKVLGALESHNQSLAERIADADYEINELYLDLEQDCIDIFALQQPVASDLRFVAASFKILTDLERIADLAVNLAATVQATSSDLFAEIAICDLGGIAIEMLEDALLAYADSDVDACVAVAERDDHLDDRCERAAQRVIRMIADDTPAPETTESLLEAVTQALLTIRDIERIGDHAVNIAARTLYMVENDDVLIY